MDTPFLRDYVDCPIEDILILFDNKLELLRDHIKSFIVFIENGKRVLTDEEWEKKRLGRPSRYV